MKVLYMSGHASESIMRQTGRNSVDDLLVKPFSLENLERTIRNMLDRPGPYTDSNVVPNTKKS